MSAQRPILLVMGTRPEGIKLAPVYHALKKAGSAVVVVSTMQHCQLLDDVLRLFDIKPDITLSIMRSGQDLFYITQSVLYKMKRVLQDVQPACVVVQGDTTTAFAAALAAFYAHIPVHHVEAGLRTGDIQLPFPEEFNRRCISLITQQHYAPTQLAVDALLAEGIAETSVTLTGNTVVDALQMMQELCVQQPELINERLREVVGQAIRAGKRIYLFTMHRRESLPEALAAALQVMTHFIASHSDAFCVYPYHPNPQVVATIQSCHALRSAQWYVCEPLSYLDMVYLLSHAHAVVTDSGGLQEEAVSLGKYTLVLREKTERMEGVVAGVAHLVGNDEQKLYEYLECAHAQAAGSARQLIYGDGKAAEKIVQLIQNELTVQAELSRYKDAHQQRASSSQDEERSLLQGDSMRVVLLGLGYIGLPTALLLVEHGCQVIGVDIDSARIAGLKSGDPMIQEPGAYERLQVALGSGLLTITDQIVAGDYYIIAVPTPFYADKTADLRCVDAATDMIASVIQAGQTVLVESTVPVKTTDAVMQSLLHKTGLSEQDIFVAHCPERVLPGNIFHELVHNDRIIGGVNQQSACKAADLYKQFVKGSLHITDAVTAELVKLVENSSRDTQIAFAHQVASMSYQLGLDPYQVIELANKHPRVQILKPSAGVGGHCIAIDPWFLIKGFPASTQLLAAARQVNDQRPHQILDYILQSVAQETVKLGRKPTVALMGLTYKPDVDDLRESPALDIAQHLMHNDALKLLVCEPQVKPMELKLIFGDRVESITQAVHNADIIVFLVAHTRFALLDQHLIHTRAVLDFCGVLQSNAQDQKDFWPTATAACMHMKHKEMT